jgi:hypothetical protein
MPLKAESAEFECLNKMWMGISLNFQQRDHRIVTGSQVAKLLGISCTPLR